MKQSVPSSSEEESVSLMISASSLDDKADDDGFSWSQISRIQRSRSSSLSCSIDQAIDQRPAVDFPGETGSINPQADLIDLLLSHLNLAAADESDQSSDEISANRLLE